MRTRTGLGVLVLAAAVGAGCSGPSGQTTGNNNTGSSSSGGASSSSSGGGESSSGGGVDVINAHTTGALTGDNIRAAVSWSAYNQALTDCLEPIEFTPPLDPYENPAHEEIIYQLSLCIEFYAEGTQATTSVPLDAQATSFDVPVGAIPLPAIVTGQNGGALGMGGVLVYQDGNGNRLLDMVAPGARESVDTVLGASVAVDEDATQHSLVIWREGALSPLWKLFQGVYDCLDEPPQGFSVVTVTFNDMTGLFDCQVSAQGSVEIVLSDSTAMRQEICLPGPQGPRYRYPEGPLPADVVAQCQDESTLLFTNTPQSICPIVERYDLVGCTDTSSEAACYATLWDIRDNPPSWWPCSNGTGTRPTFRAEATQPVTTGRDQLLSLQVTGGTWTRSINELELEITLDESGRTVTLRGADLVLEDADGNQVLNAGDRLRVFEPEGQDIFNPQSRPGLYPARLLDLAVSPAIAVYNTSIAPVDLPGAPEQMELAIEDVGGGLTSGLDALMTITATQATGAYALADLAVDVMYSCEVPERFAGAALALTADANMDGLFGQGDTLTVTETQDMLWPWDQDRFDFYNCVTLRLSTGFNHSVSVGGGAWVGLELVVEDAPAALTAGADDLFTMTMTGGRNAFAVADLRLRVFLQGASVATFSVGQGLTHVDADNGGSFNLGDSLAVRETEALPVFSQDGDRFYGQLELVDGTRLGGGAWYSTPL